MEHSKQNKRSTPDFLKIILIILGMLFVVQLFFAWRDCMAGRAVSAHSWCSTTIFLAQFLINGTFIERRTILQVGIASILSTVLLASIFDVHNYHLTGHLRGFDIILPILSVLLNGAVILFIDKIRSDRWKTKSKFELRSK